MTTPSKRKPTSKDCKPSRVRARKKGRSDQKPTAGQVVGMAILSLGRRIMGEPEATKAMPGWLGGGGGAEKIERLPIWVTG